MSEAKVIRKQICAPEIGTGWRDADGNYAVVTGISVRYSWDNGEHAGDDVVDLAEFQETFKADASAESAQPAERAGEWVSVEERRPLVADSVLFTNGRHVCKGYWDGRATKGEFAWHSIGGTLSMSNDVVTHWMPLPPPPQPKGKP